jgi:hypothetical protein
MLVPSLRALLAASRRTLAAGCAALVLALSIFAASPAAHAWLHAESGGCSGHAHPAPQPADDDDAGCAVVLFASGVSLPVAPAFLTPPTLAVQGVSPVTAADAFLVSPRYLRQPERGPPALV